MYASRHRGGVDDINAHLGVEGLCNSLPKRLDLLYAAEYPNERLKLPGRRLGRCRR